MKVGVATICMLTHSEPTLNQRLAVEPLLLKLTLIRTKKILQNVAIFLNCVAICLPLKVVCVHGSSVELCYHAIKLEHGSNHC